MPTLPRSLALAHPIIGASPVAACDSSIDHQLDTERFWLKSVQPLQLCASVPINGVDAGTQLRIVEADSIELATVRALKSRDGARSAAIAILPVGTSCSADWLDNLIREVLPHLGWPEGCSLAESPITSASMQWEWASTAPSPATFVEVVVQHLRKQNVRCEVDNGSLRISRYSGKLIVEVWATSTGRIFGRVEATGQGALRRLGLAWPEWKVRGGRKTRYGRSAIADMDDLRWVAVVRHLVQFFHLDDLRIGLAVRDADKELWTTPEVQVVDDWDPIEVVSYPTKGHELIAKHVASFDAFYRGGIAERIGRVERDIERDGKVSRIELVKAGTNVVQFARASATLDEAGELDNLIRLVEYEANIPRRDAKAARRAVAKLDPAGLTAPSEIAAGVVLAAARARGAEAKHRPLLDVLLAKAVQIGGNTFPLSLSLLEADTGVSRPTVSRHSKQLEALGVIDRKVSYDGETTVITLLDWPSDTELATSQESLPGFPLSAECTHYLYMGMEGVCVGVTCHQPHPALRPSADVFRTAGVDRGRRLSDPARLVLQAMRSSWGPSVIAELSWLPLTAEEAGPTKPYVFSVLAKLVTAGLVAESNGKYRLLPEWRDRLEELPGEIGTEGQEAAQREAIYYRRRPRPTTEDQAQLAESPSLPLTEAAQGEPNRGVMAVADALPGPHPTSIIEPELVPT